MKTMFILIIMLSASPLFAQVKETKLYDPSADAAQELKSALATAAHEGKNVLLQVGGNWCPWCLKLDKLFSSNQRIDSLLKKDYVLLRVNYSKENKNLQLLSQLGYPQRFGFPVLLVLDEKGNRLHTQDSGFLESGDHHDPDKVFTFLSKWTKKSFDPKQYIEK